MSTPENNQVAICLLKSDLESIENELVSQRSSIPDMDTENEQKFRETMKALETARLLSGEIEKLRQENMRLVAKRMQLKRQKEEIDKQMDKALDSRAKLEAELRVEDHKTELLVRQYEDSLSVKAERFRSTHGYYNEEKMQAEIESEKEKIANLERACVERQRIVDENKSEIAAMVSDVRVPDDLLDIVGKHELEQKLAALDTQLRELSKEKEKITPPPVSGQ